MPRPMLVLLLVCWATPMAGQWAGLPVWNRPSGRTGFALGIDYGRPNEDGRKGSAFGARASLGIGTVSLTGGISAWKPDSALSGGADWIVSPGATAAIRLLGGSLLPIAINFQVGVGRSGKASTTLGSLPATTVMTGSIGLSTVLPAPGVRIEAFCSPGIRHHSAQGVSSQTNFGWVVGAALDFGRLGLHVAYDGEKSEGILGIGVHLALRPF